MKATIAKTFTFDAAHVLPNHDGKCARPHGHTYTVTIGVAGEVRGQDGSSSEGMVVDFGVLHQAWAKLEPTLDHQDLNVTLKDEVPITTSEYLAAHLYMEFEKHMPEGVAVKFCRVAETPTSWAQVQG